MYGLAGEGWCSKDVDDGSRVFQRNQNNQWVLFEYGMDDRTLLESINVEITIAKPYRQM